jgi:hypothetical protein
MQIPAYIRPILPQSGAFALDTLALIQSVEEISNQYNIGKNMRFYSLSHDKIYYVIESTKEALPEYPSLNWEGAVQALLTRAYLFHEYGINKGLMIKDIVRIVYYLRQWNYENDKALLYGSIKYRINLSRAVLIGTAYGISTNMAISLMLTEQAMKDRQWNIPVIENLWELYLWNEKDDKPEYWARDARTQLVQELSQDLIYH